MLLYACAELALSNRILQFISTSQRYGWNSEQGWKGFGGG